jgi:hypothetical protein
MHKKTRLIWLAGALVALALAAADRGFAQRRHEGLERIAASTDVAWLEKIAGSLEATAELGPRRLLAQHAKDIRTAAYARLGELGTEESLAAATRIEARETSRSLLTPDRVPLENWTHPCWHFGDDTPGPLAQTEAPDGTTYAVILITPLLGDLDLFLIESRTPEDPKSWSRPKLLPVKVYRGITEVKLGFPAEGNLAITWVQEAPPARRIMEGTQDPGAQAPALGPQRVEIKLADALRDADGDGWTDGEEKRLGLDPAKADTDGDGVTDGVDGCPNYAPPPGEADDEECQLIQKALFATFGLSGSRFVLLGRPGAPGDPPARKVQLSGYRGPLIYIDDPQRWQREHELGAVHVFWMVQVTGDTARVSIHDSEGPLAAGSQYVHLKKIDGRWVVVRRETGRVS